MALFDKDYFPRKLLNEQVLISLLLGFVSLIALYFFVYSPYSPGLIIGCTSVFFLVAISSTLSRLLPDSGSSSLDALYWSFLPLLMLVNLSWASGYFLDGNHTFVWILISALILSVFIWLLFRVAPDPSYEGSGAQILYLLGASLSALALFLFWGVSEMESTKAVLVAGLVSFSYTGIFLQVQFRRRKSILVASILVGLLVGEVSVFRVFLPLSSIEVGFLLFLVFSCLSSVAAALIAKKFRELSLKWLAPLIVFSVSIFWLFLYL